MSGFELAGFEELTSRLIQIGTEGKTIEEKAVKAGADVMRDAIEEAIPVSVRSSNHAKDNIVIGEIQDGSIPIGPDKKHFYLQFAEFGTSKQPAQGFMSRAFEDTKSESQKKMADVIKGELGL